MDVKIWTRRLFLICYDIVAVGLASVIALSARFDFRWAYVPDNFKQVMWQSVLLSEIITIAIFGLLHLYSSLWSYASTTELLYIVSACIIDSIVNMACILVIWHKAEGLPLPRSYYLFYGMFLLAFTLFGRYFYRLVRIARGHVFIDKAKRKRILIVGAGEAGSALIKEITGSKEVSMQIVGIVDDNPAKKGTYIHGIRVLGNRACIMESCEELGVQEIMIALPSASAQEMKGILEICKETGCELKRLPGMYQMINGDVSVSKLKEVDVNDLLGREPVEVDLNSILGYVSGKVVLVTGGGGSIGSEICRQVAGHKPERLIIVDIYENNAYDVQQELKTKYPWLDLVVLVASVRNTKRMDDIFAHYKPDIVYHAAAHKHVPLMEESPNEAVKNNVLGTWKVVQASDKAHVKKFVMISTDKAVNPTNIMGATKRICEMIIQTYNNRSQTEFVAVRFGNVLGSNGSVIPLFKRQIEAGGPVTVTHPDIIRYFMTIPEAVSLVLQAGAFAKGGEIFVLDMGEPVKILDLANNLILLSGHKPGEDIRIEFTGLRPGEKLYEEMLMDEEGLQDTANHMIHIGRPIEFDEEKFLQELEELKEYVVNEPEDIRVRVQRIVPTYSIQKK